MGRSEGRPVTNFVPAENLTRVQSPLLNGADAFARSMLLRRLLHEAEKPSLTRQQLDAIDRHIAELRHLIYRQVELVEKDKLKSRDAEQVQNLLAMLNDLMGRYQTLRRRINSEFE
jgi:hypothetical protein